MSQMWTTSLFFAKMALVCCLCGSSVAYSHHRVYSTLSLSVVQRWQLSCVAGETGPVPHMSGDLPRPQGPLLPSCLLPGVLVHPAASRATGEKPGGGVSPVPQCCLCGRQWPQFPPYGVLHQWTDWGVRDLEKGIEQWDYLSELLWSESHLFLLHLWVCLYQLYRCPQETEDIWRP